MAVATDPISGRAIQRSFTLRGDRADAEARCAELAADYAVSRIVIQAAPFLTVDELLERWLIYDVHIENVSLIANYRSQFDRIIRGSSYEELVRRLKQKRGEFLNESAPRARRSSG